MTYNHPNYQQQQNQKDNSLQFPNLDLPPIQNSDQVLFNHDQHLFLQQNMGQQQLQQQINGQQIQQQISQNYAQHIYQQNPAHQQFQSCGQYNQNNNDNNDSMMMMTTQILSQQQPIIYNDHLPSSNCESINNNEDDILTLRISHRMLMIKDCIMMINRQYVELEQDFIKLRRSYN
nr:1022_t:CDS:1 [Entrophospora candida]